ncbi:MAG TPA: zinc dependent phospholipase C family protein [Terriglobia bacterium]|nr:zinc dependent phospholipase C family protein [Terriglobia bacterium]
MTGRIAFGKVARMAVFVALLLGAPSTLPGYSVLSHEALIDAAWDPVIIPLLVARYPNATPAQLAKARAYAYGGCVIQDLGYYPFGDKFFSDLTHYVRTGGFVKALLKESRNVDEYAFALGALSHYVADNTGHSLAVNRSVPDMYPRLQRKYGKLVTYEDDPRAHVMVEFSFDVVQVAGAGYLPRTYHNFIGFRVPTSLLKRAFKDTYDLKFGGPFFYEDFSIKVYEVSASEVIPTLTQIAWRHEKKKIIRVNPQFAQRKFAYRLARENYERQASKRRRPRWFLPKPWKWRWKTTAEEANVGALARLMVWFIEVLPKVGPLQTLSFKPPTPQVQDLFIRSFDVTVARYESDLSKVRAKNLALADTNLDIGRQMRAGHYELADKTYAKLLSKLAKRHFQGVTPRLRQNILAFYGNVSGPIPPKESSKMWRKTLRQLAVLKATRLQAETASH